MSDDARKRAKALIDEAFEGIVSESAWPLLQCVQEHLHESIPAELSRLEAELAEARASLESLHEECDRQLAVEVDRLRAALARSEAARAVAVGALTWICDCGSAWKRKHIKAVARDALAHESPT